MSASLTRGQARVTAASGVEVENTRFQLTAPYKSHDSLAGVSPICCQLQFRRMPARDTAASAGPSLRVGVLCLDDQEVFAPEGLDDFDGGFGEEVGPFTAPPETGEDLKRVPSELPSPPRVEPTSP